jgi:hypothetical protein
MRTNDLLWQNMLAAPPAEPSQRKLGMQTREVVRAPNFVDSLVDTVILRAIFVGGVERKVGDKVLMASSDAAALASTTPPTIEYIK